VSEEERAAAPAEEEVPQGSVFGNLPGSRPGVRSPRRDRAPGARTAGPQAPNERPDAEDEPVAESAATPRPRPEPPAEPGGEPAEHGRGIEDVAWAGVAAAAEAATIGVRIANRALEALRDAVDRR
jgi:hypothetical protein